MGRGVRRGNQVRIIGGEHRGRKLDFPDIQGLRPTGDRIRETLFNWLQVNLPGAECLDLFAGSGALGLEAASRGAGRVLMLDRSPVAVDQLRQNISLLGLNQASVEQADALVWLQAVPQPFDIVFLDPPFADELLQQVCHQLVVGGWLKPNALLYIETDAVNGLPQLPSVWRRLKEKKAGQVGYFLYSSR
ncbi:MAG: 16S rRNA (guanine(966)-N(2))-methyltransferase RsmD [Gammaproteobacteria bacterium]|nr:16S rRNA (guanine(966)-N(2))-methyltransferase RsmD [Gammaproteobacteria bacterium]